MLAPFRVRGFRFQWAGDLAMSWAVEMEVLILGWYVLIESGSVSLLAVFGALLLNAGQGTPQTATEAGDRFFVMFLATSIGFTLSFIALVMMEEKPLRSAAKHSAEAVIVD